MLRLFFTITLIHFASSLVAQKKLIDTSTFSKWPFLQVKAISNDGRYLTYTLSSKAMGERLIVQDLDSNCKRELTGVLKSIFTEDNRWLILKIGDSLGLLDLHQDKLKYIDHVADYKTPEEGDGHWLACLLDGPENELMLLSLSTTVEKHFQHVQNFKFNKQGTALVVQMLTPKDSALVPTLAWVDLSTGKEITIYRGYQTKDFEFDGTGSMMAFLSSGSFQRSGETTLCYYKMGMDSAVTLVDQSSVGMEGLSIAGGSDILVSDQGDKIFFTVSKKHQDVIPIRTRNGLNVKILTYQDEVFRFNERNLDSSKFLAVVPLTGDRKVLQLSASWRLPGHRVNDENYVDDIHAILDYAASDHHQKISPNRDIYSDIYLFSAENGARKLIIKHKWITFENFSPGGNYLIWYDCATNQWYTYNITRGCTKNITSRNLPDLLRKIDYPGYKEGPFDLVGWLENDAAVLMQGQYDLWEVDPEGIKPPISLTSNYGLRTHTDLHYMHFQNQQSPIIHPGDTLMLWGFQQDTKKNGFYRLILGKHNTSEKLVMEPRMYYAHYESVDNFDFFLPLKAKGANRYIVARMSESEFPNLYQSKDLREFKEITNFEPQKEFNWYKTELLHWRLPDGRPGTGILYKPEDFDPQKKYPVIFYYYQTNSNSLHNFLDPMLSGSTINIPWFVSNGYLVFIPDITFLPGGHTGQTACNAVVSAAKYLSEKSFVDTKHLGLQGASFGGFETNYIVSHSTMFAAAVSSLSMSNLIESYLEREGQEYFESAQGRIGATLWQRPDLYIENSSVFRADKVITPILLLQNPDDGVTLLNQGLEWFNALARLGKKVWMLSYPGEGHGISSDEGRLDFSIRMRQFFDYYLKEAPPPKWMTRDMGPNSQDIDYSLDYSGKTP